MSALQSRRWGTVDDRVGYLYRCVLNAGRMELRSAARRRRREDRVFRRRTSTNDDFAGDFLVTPEVRSAIGALSPRQRAVVFLTRCVTALALDDGLLRLAGDVPDPADDQLVTTTARSLGAWFDRTINDTTRIADEVALVLTGTGEDRADDLTRLRAELTALLADPSGPCGTDDTASATTD